jgi:hypothetical protein
MLREKRGGVLKGDYNEIKLNTLSNKFVVQNDSYCVLGEGALVCLSTEVDSYFNQD